MPIFYDPVTGTPVDTLKQDTFAWKPTEDIQDIKTMADALYQWLDNQGRGHNGYAPQVPMAKHARDSYVTDHALLTSAISYCLAYERSETDDASLLQSLRLAALSHELTSESQEKVAAQLPDVAPFLKKAWSLLTQQGEQIAQSLDQAEYGLERIKPAPDDDERLQLLWAAHLAASGRLYNQVWADPNAPNDTFRNIASLTARADFDRHPLSQVTEMIALVHGGATKVKGYVFESARLPEVRGASSLFDRLNTLDVPALWGREPQTKTYRAAAYQEAQDRCQQVRRQFSEDALASPECILYASGGNILALAPPKVANALATAIEWLYTTETLVGNSVAAAQSFTLLELQYGRQPQAYWLDEFNRDIASVPNKPLLTSYYGGATPAHFIAHKGFGELVTLMASQTEKRRAGRGHDAGRPQRAIPHFELLPQTMNCHSCDTRPAVAAIDQTDVPANQTAKAFCEPCARKRVAGQVAKRDEGATKWFTELFDWYPTGVSSWESIFTDFQENDPQLALYMADRQASHKRSSPIKGAQDIQEIGSASSPAGYVGYIYADGNDIGALVARIRTPAAYRQFGQRLYAATQAAIFTALAQHLRLHWQEQAPRAEVPHRDSIWIHPFEVVTIGGDDLIVIVPGDKALPIAATIAYELERRLTGPRPTQKESTKHRHIPERYHAHLEEEATLWGDDHWPVISLSAGIVIAREHTPVTYIEKLAEQLQKSAKKARKSGHLRNYPGGTVDFAALKSTGMVSLPWSDYRKRAYKAEAPWRLTARPYTWHELRGLLQTVRVLKLNRFPRSQIYRLQEDLISQNWLAASVNYLYFLSRHSKEARHHILTAFQYAWHQEHDVPPWRKINGASNGTQAETIWRDLVEIYDFVPLLDELTEAKEEA
ncbi:MAG: hypothetical protein KDJ65_21600 [Anaerolineae bacterium]|nr:hypothetical protein [Anaerolineae bacterium]